MGKWMEIRNDFYDDIEGCTCIDAWTTPDDNEEGTTIAKVYDNGRVEYIDPDAGQDEYAQEVIRETLEELRDAEELQAEMWKCAEQENAERGE